MLQLESLLTLAQFVSAFSLRDKGIMHQAITLRSHGAKQKEMCVHKAVPQLNDSFCSLHFCQRPYCVGDVWSAGVCVFNAIEH